MFITPDYKRNHVIFLVNNVLEKTSQRVKADKILKACLLYL